MKKFMIASLVALSASVFAEETTDIAPYQYGLIMPDFAIEKPTTRINGYVAGFWTENPQSALSISIFNGATGDSKGFQVGGVINYAENYAGVQLAPINKVSNNFSGWQIGVFNYVRGTCKGFQLGLLNIASNAKGLQIGIINSATVQHGLQIGVANINTSNKFFTELPGELAPGMILVNWKF